MTMMMMNPLGAGATGATPLMAGGNNSNSEFHPDFMFCGSCTTCQPTEEKKSASVGETLDDYLLSQQRLGNDSEEDEYELEAGDKVSIEEGYLYYDEPAGSQQGAGGTAPPAAPGAGAEPKKP